jgi:hypothetical protein
MKNNLLSIKIILIIFSLNLFAFAYSQNHNKIVNQSNNKHFKPKESKESVFNQSLQIKQNEEKVMHNKKELLQHNEDNNNSQSLPINQSEKKVMHNKKELFINNDTNNNSIQSEKKEYLLPSETNKKISSEKT